MEKVYSTINFRYTIKTVFNLHYFDSIQYSFLTKKEKTNIMWIFQSTFLLAITLAIQLHESYGQENVCNAAAIVTCGSYTCVQTGDVYSCLCSDLTLKPSAAACNGGTAVTTTQPTVVIPNQCAVNTCPAGSTCIPTNQNPALYVCVCPNNVLANPDCPTGQIANNPCLLSNPCRNGGTCVVNLLSLQPVCICPTGTYGSNCASACRQTCDSNW